MSASPHFAFAGSLPAHDAAVRAILDFAPSGIVTGSLDNSVRLFGEAGELLAALKVDCWVLSLARLDGTRFVAGMRDGSCRVLACADGSMVELWRCVGHTGPVGSLSIAGGVCVSGGWDETARVWDLEARGCVEVLGGHENNVTALALQRGGCVTGSSGLTADGAIVGVALRAFAPGPAGWRLVARADGAHDAAIRCLVELDAGSALAAAFASCSNDGHVSLWSENLERVARLGAPTDPFKYALVQVGPSSFASGDEAGEVVVHDAAGGAAPAALGGDASKPWGCVWCAARLACGDVVAGTASGSVVRWTRDAARAAPPDALDDALRAGGAGSDAGGAAANAVEAGAPLADERAAYVGASEGDVSLFREGGGTLAAFRWAAGGWERVGPVVAATRRAPKEELDGVWFDRVITVEIDSASRGFLVMMLGFNHDDDPADVARGFCAKHGLLDEYVEHIAAYVASHLHSHRA